MSAAILTLPSPTASPWIISKRDDLVWFIGSSLLGYVALIALGAGLPALTAFLVWKLAIDGPHVWSTTSRTYFDKQARQRLGWRLWVVIPLLAIGPVLFWLGLGRPFFFAVVTWAQYHIGKQHFGFVMLYKRKTGERIDVKLDRYFLLTSLLLPWSIFLAAELNFVSYRIARIALVAILALYAGFVGFYLRRQFQKWRAGEVVNHPKLLLFGLVLPLQWLAFLYAIGRPQGIVVAGIATNLGHSFQYLRLMWFHNRNRYSGQAAATIGAAGFINRSCLVFFFTALSLNFLVTVVLRMQLSSEVVLSALIGFNMAHYYIDSLIWRTRADKELAQALGVS